MANDKKVPANPETAGSNDPNLAPAREPIHRPEGDSNVAKQSEILIADIEHAREWIQTVSALVERQLPYPQFIAAYMEALKDWTSDRKLTQSRLHWRYGPSRRRKRLIDRDSKKQIQNIRQKFDTQLTAFLNEHPDAEERHPALARAHRELVSQSKPTRPSVRDMTKVDRGIAQLIADEVGADVSALTDDEIITAYQQHGYDRDVALAWLSELTTGEIS